MISLGGAITGFLGVAGCANAPSNYAPNELIVDRQFVDQAQYGVDLCECPRYAEQVRMA